jgi:hypothetical protein
MFVKFDCGCIGILREGDDPVIVKGCDGEDDLGFWVRGHMDKKGYVKVAILETHLIQQIGRLISDGYALRNIRNVLNLQIDMGQDLYKVQEAQCSKEKKEGQNEAT